MPEAREQHLGSSLKQRHYRQEADACVPPVTTCLLLPCLLAIQRLLSRRLVGVGELAHEVLEPRGCRVLGLSAGLDPPLVEGACHLDVEAREVLG